MVLGIETRPGLALTSLIEAFSLSLKVEGKSPKTVAYYRGSLCHLAWYAKVNGWGEDIRGFDRWRLRGFLDYFGDGANRLPGTPPRPVRGETRVFPHYKCLRVFFAWLATERLLLENPMEGIKVARPKALPL